MAKSKTKFNPCNDSGQVVAQVIGAKDFSDFCLLMSDQSEKARAYRKNAYDAISETGEATPKAKIDFVRAVSLDYFKHQLKSGNALSAQALSNDSTQWDEAEAEKFISAMGKEFRGLIVAVGSDVFDGMLTSSNMTPQARSALVKALWSGDEFAKEVVDIALKAESGGAAKAVASWKQTPEARSRMASRVAVEKASDRMSLNPKYGVYAPLLKFLTEQMGVAQRAEYFARFEDYANSGFLDLDLALKRNAVQEGLEATPAARTWKNLANMVMTGSEPQPSAKDVKNALNARLAEVGKSMAVSGIKSGNASAFRAQVSPLSAQEVEAMALKGEVDVFTLNADGTARVSFVTSNQMANTQNAQWARHFVAVENSLTEMGVKSATYRVLAPCLVTDRPVAGASVAVGAPLAQWFAGNQKLGEVLQGVINAAPFLTELMNGSTDVLNTAKVGSVGQWASRMELDLIGSEKNAWTQIRKSIQASETPDVEFKKQMLRAAGILLVGLAQGAKQRASGARTLHGVASMDKSGPQMELLLGFTRKVVEMCLTSKEVELLEDFKALNGNISKVVKGVDLGNSARNSLKMASNSLEAEVKDLSKEMKKSQAAKNLGK